MTMSKQILGVTIRTWWTLVIAVVVSTLGTWAAVDHSNANQQRSQARANQQFRRAQILANQKFQQAIRISIQQSAYSTNKSVCGWRGFLKPTLTDPRIPKTRRDEIATFLASQVTVPATFKCGSLPKNPPKAGP